MANRRLATTHATFEATVQRTKNRLIAIPADVQRQLGLARRPNNYLLHFSIRHHGQGRWNSHWAQLTADNEFCIPTDVSDIRPGSHVQVRIHGAVVADVDVLAQPQEMPKNPGELLLTLVGTDDDPRTDGSINLDEYLYRD